MSDKFKMKWRMLVHLLHSDDCILVTFKDDDFDYRFCGNDYMMSSLYYKLMRYIPDWFYKWRKKEAKKEKDGEQVG